MISIVIYIFWVFNIFIVSNCFFLDSIRGCLGRKVKLSLKVLVKLETKSDKTENRILVSQFDGF